VDRITLPAESAMVQPVASGFGERYARQKEKDHRFDHAVMNKVIDMYCIFHHIHWITTIFIGYLLATEAEKKVTRSMLDVSSSSSPGLPLSDSERCTSFVL